MEKKLETMSNDLKTGTGSNEFDKKLLIVTNEFNKGNVLTPD